MTVTQRLQGTKPVQLASEAELDRQACAMARAGWRDAEIRRHFAWPMSRLYVAYRRVLGEHHERAP
jgi:hypothetical protein